MVFQKRPQRPHKQLKRLQKSVAHKFFITHKIHSSTYIIGPWYTARVSVGTGVVYRFSKILCNSMSCQKMVLKPFNYTGTSCDTFGKRLPVYQTSSLPKMQCDWLNYITRSATDDVTTTEYFLCYRISLRLLWTLHVYSTISVLPGSYYICTWN